MHLDWTVRTNWLHRINPSVKLLVSLSLFIFILFVHNLNVLVNFTVVNLLLFLLYSGHPPRRLLLFSLPFLLIFISTSTSMMFFGKGTTTWFQWGWVHITEESFLRGVHLGFRALNFALLGLLFALTTRPALLFYSLMQQWRLPPKYAYSFMAALRLIPIMLEEFQTLRHALKVRGIQRKKGLGRFYRTLQAYSIPLLAQSIRRAQRIAVAMEARRFQSGTARTYYYEVSYSGYDMVYAFYYLIGIIIVTYMGVHFPYWDAADVRFLPNM
jgi:energy-coupling factor transport system permease protein